MDGNGSNEATNDTDMRKGSEGSPEKLDAPSSPSAPGPSNPQKNYTMDDYLNSAKERSAKAASDFAKRKRDTIFKKKDFPSLGPKNTNGKRIRAPSNDTGSDEETLDERVNTLEFQMRFVKTHLSREMGYSRKTNLVLYQFAEVADEKPSDSSVLTSAVAKFINEQIIKIDNWCDGKIVTAFRINSVSRPYPIIARFTSPENATQILINCKNLRELNSDLKKQGKRAITVKRHNDAYTASAIHYMQQLAGAMKTTTQFKDCRTFIKDHPYPALLIDGKQFELDKILKAIKALNPMPEELR